MWIYVELRNLKFLLSFLLYILLYVQFDIMFDENLVDCYVRIHITGFHLGGGGGWGGIRPPLPESRPPLEIRLALFLLKR